MDFFDIIDDMMIEEEEEIRNYLNPPLRKPRQVRPRPDHFEEWDAAEFKRRFRLQKETVQFLLMLIEDHIKHNTERNQCAPPMLQLLVSLRFYATGSFYITVGDFSGLHSSTICGIIKRVTSAIASLRPRFIYLPRNQEEILQSQEHFYNRARFPRVVVALDCTHVKIISPGGDNAETFRNRKGVFSINVQAMCNADLKFEDIVSRWPGSTHDSLIFANSAAKYHFDNGSFGNGVILGDSGYFINQYLMTPFINPETPAENLFNESHTRTRNVIERCFGVWKRRFPILSIGMRCKLQLVQDVIVATAILHNLARMRNDEEPPVDPQVYVPPEEQPEPEEEDGQLDRVPNNTRETFVEYFQTLLERH